MLKPSYHIIRHDDENIEVGLSSGPLAVSYDDLRGLFGLTGCFGSRCKKSVHALVEQLERADEIIELHV